MEACSSYMGSHWPFIDSCISLNSPMDATTTDKQWYAIFDSAVPLSEMNMTNVLKAAGSVSEEVQIIQMGYRCQVQKGFRCCQLNLHNMRRVPGTGMNLQRAWGQKMLLATAKGIQYLRDRLLKGPPCFFDHCVGELQRTGVVKMMKRPLCGSRRHFSLATAGTGAWIQEELAIGSSVK